eukprot:4629669-Amphidinium_carterae.1
MQDPHMPKCISRYLGGETVINPNGMVLNATPPRHTCFKRSERSFYFSAPTPPLVSKGAALSRRVKWQTKQCQSTLLAHYVISNRHQHGLPA